MFGSCVVVAPVFFANVPDRGKQESAWKCFRVLATVAAKKYTMVLNPMWKKLFL